MDPMNIPAKFEVHIVLPVPEIIAIGVLGGGRVPQILGKRRPTESGIVPIERALPSIFCSIFTCFRDIAAFVLQHATPHL